jgi:hypothetical protein
MLHRTRTRGERRYGPGFLASLACSLVAALAAACAPGPADRIDPTFEDPEDAAPAPQPMRRTPDASGSGAAPVDAAAVDAKPAGIDAAAPTVDASTPAPDAAEPHADVPGADAASPDSSPVDAAGPDAAPAGTMVPSSQPLRALGLAVIAASDLDPFATWLGRDVDYVVAYANSDRWDWLADVGDLVRTYIAWVKRKPGRRLVLSVPLLVKQSEGNMAGVARGDFDAHFRRLAENLVKDGVGDSIIRLGWEMNGEWYPWAAGRTEQSRSNWRNAWRRVVGVMRRVPGAKFEFDWTMNSGDAGTGTRFAEVYPGDEWVDIIGLDTYDIKYDDCAISPQGRWDFIVGQRNGLREHKAFAESRRKPMSYPEWGLWVTGPPYCGGGDNAFYIERMAAWIKSNDVRYHAYFNVGPYAYYHREHRLSRNPRAQAAFKAAFGK